MNNFVKRTLSGAVYVAIVVGAIYSGRLLEGHVGHAGLLGWVLFAAVFLFVGITATWEICDCLKRRGMEVNTAAAYGVGIATYVAVLAAREDVRPLLVLPALWLAVALWQLWRRDQRPFATIGYTLLPTVWVMVPLAMMSMLQEKGLVMMVFILIWVNDSFAYITGRLLGRHPMWTRHSPKKTWEGTIGGAVFCMACAMLAGPLFRTTVPLEWWDWLVIGLICSVIGTLGDLTESMFKRSCGVKDSGSIMPGHGGLLDRFDSIVMTVPFVVAYLVVAGVN